MICRGTGICACSSTFNSWLVYTSSTILHNFECPWVCEHTAVPTFDTKSSMQYLQFRMSPDEAFLLSGLVLRKFFLLIVSAEASRNTTHLPAF